MEQEFNLTIQTLRDTVDQTSNYHIISILMVVVVVLLFYVHGKHLRSCRDGQLT